MSEPEAQTDPRYCAYTSYESRPGVTAENLPATGEGATGTERRVWDALHEVEDPEMPVSVVDLGLVYGVSVEDRSPTSDDDGAGDSDGGGVGDGEGNGDGSGVSDSDADGRHATVTMTLTYTGCPAREMLLEDVETAAASVAGVESATVELVWSPPWSVEFVTDAGREALREFGVSV